MKRLLAFFILCLAFNVNCVAGDWLAKRKLTGVSFETGGFYLYSEGQWNNANDCSRTDAIVLKSDDVNYDKAYSLLLMAYAAGKSVQGYSDGCVNHDGRTYNAIRGFKYLRITD